MYIPCTTCLHIPAYSILLFIKYTVYCPAHCILLHILLFFTSFFSYLYLFKFSCVTYNRTVHGADLTYISLLLIFCIIMYAMNKILKMQCSAFLFRLTSPIPLRFQALQSTSKLTVRYTIHDSMNCHRIKLLPAIHVFSPWLSCCTRKYIPLQMYNGLYWSKPY